jgi:hypothetical protein
MERRITNPLDLGEKGQPWIQGRPFFAFAQMAAIKVSDDRLSVCQSNMLTVC